MKPQEDESGKVIVESHAIECVAKDCHGVCLDDIMMLSYSTLRVALATEIKTGMRRSHGRPSSVIANEHMGTNMRNKRQLYQTFNAWLVERGAQDRPLPDAQ